MKLSKTAQWILTVLLLVVLICVAVVMFNKQRVIQSDLGAQLTQVQQEYTKHKAQRSDLEGRLNRAKADLSRQQEKFHRPTESVEITDAIFAAAKRANVDITSISSPFPKEGKARGDEVTTFDVFTLTIEAKGDVATKLLKFSDALSATFPGSIIKSETVAVDNKQIGVTLTLYTYKGT